MSKLGKYDICACGGPKLYQNNGQPASCLSLSMLEVNLIPSKFNLEHIYLKNMDSETSDFDTTEICPLCETSLNQTKHALYKSKKCFHYFHANCFVIELYNENIKDTCPDCGEKLI